MQQTTPISGTSGPTEPARDLRVDELELWDRVLKRWNEYLGRQFKIGVGVVSFVLIVIGFLGVRSLGMMIEDAVESGAKSAVSNAQADIDRDTKRLSEQLAERLATIAVDIAVLQQQTKKGQELIAEMEAARDRFTVIETELKDRIKGVEDDFASRLGTLKGEFANFTQELENSRTTIKNVQDNIGRVDRIASSLALAASPSQGEAQIAPPADVQPDAFSVISIRQVPTPLDKAQASSGSSRQNYLLTLSAVVDDDTPAAALLNAIENVTYTLSDKWFSPNVFVQTNRNDNFQFSITIWGVTPIKAKAQFFGKAEPICWAGQMNLHQEAELSRTACDS